MGKEDPFDSKVKSLPQKGWVQGDDRMDSGSWKVSPVWPVKMPYPIIELDEKDYSLRHRIPESGLLLDHGPQTCHGGEIVQGHYVETHRETPIRFRRVAKGTTDMDKG